MPQSEPNSPSVRQLLDAIAKVRDNARLRLHLLSLEAKKRAEELDDKLFELGSRLEREGEKVADTATARLQELSSAAKDLLGEPEPSAQSTMPARSLMTSAPATCSPSDRLSRAAQLMWETDCGAVPVVSPDGELVGMVSDRDVCMAAYTRGLAPQAISVESTMSRAVYTAQPEDSIGHVAKIMAQGQIRRVPIVQKGRLIGIVSLADICRHIESSVNLDLPSCVALAHTLARISENRRGADSPNAPAS